MSLADHLDLRNLPLATTPGGTNFAMKALHPSEHTIKAARLPGGNRLSVALCSDAVQTFNISNPQTSVLVINSPDIICPCTVHMTEADAHVGTDVYAFMNSAFGGSVIKNPTNDYYNDRLQNSLIGKVEAYRITSQSVTVELIAPALSDQGTITSCQREIRPKTMSWVDSSTAETMRMYSDVDWYILPNLESSSMVLGTSAYTAKAREGAYQPLKLTDLSWKTFNDPSLPVMTKYTDMNTYGQQGYAPIKWFSVAASAAPEEKRNPILPHFEDRVGVTSFDVLRPSPKPCGYNFGFTRVEGVSANTAVRVRVRQVVEIMAPPSTLYAPLLETALPPDETAIRMYFEVSARMADAYPAAYNDLGKLRDIVKRIAGGVFKYAEPALSLLSSVPGPVGTVAGIGKQVVGAVNTARERRKSLPRP